MRGMNASGKVPEQRAVLIVVIGLLIPLFYLASIGPAFGLYERGFISYETYFAYIQPCCYTVAYIPHVRLAIEEYAGLFSKRP